jgi:hypothetical protein
MAGILVYDLVIEVISRCIDTGEGLGRRDGLAYDRKAGGIVIDSLLCESMACDEQSRERKDDSSHYVVFFSANINIFVGTLKRKS